MKKYYAVIEVERAYRVPIEAESLADATSQAESMKVAEIDAIGDMGDVGTTVLEVAEE